jgi:indole-3-glycerol phosphate synthase
MTDMLDKLYAAKDAARARDEAYEPLDVVRARGDQRRGERRRLRDALVAADGPALIAEIKRASPSVGLIVRELDPAAIAREYEAAGANAISVLTEGDYFLGDLAYLDRARAAARLPILRKDFLRTRYDVAQSAAYGADAVLAIVAGLDDDELAAMFDEASRYELDVLVEVHDEPELRRAIAAGARLLGINNRDLRTFKTDLSVTAELLPLVPSSVVVISESGVRSPEDVKPLYAAGARGFLVGESLMRAPNKAELVRALRGRTGRVPA